MGQSREKLLGLDGWMSGNLVLRGRVLGVGAYSRLGAKSSKYGTHRQTNGRLYYKPAQYATKKRHKHCIQNIKFVLDIDSC